MDDEDAGEGDLHVEPEDHLLHPPRVHPSQRKRVLCSRTVCFQVSRAFGVPQIIFR